TLPHADWLAAADLFGFEFGRTDWPINETASDPIGADQAEPLAILQSVFLAAVADERARRAATGALPRLFMGIDCIHNRMEALFGTHIAAAITPFGSRLRHGFVAAEPEKSNPESTARLLIGYSLGRDRPTAGKEVEFPQKLFSPLLLGEEITADP